MKVSDEDLEMLAKLEQPGGRLFFSERRAVAIAIDELRALRKVADEAKRSLDSRCAYNAEDYDLERALKEAGYA